MDKYHFRKYNPKFKKFFTEESNKIKNILGNNSQIEHIGSTAIPNLGGKGIIDILIGVGDREMESTKLKLMEVGYEFREVASTKERLFFRIDYPYKKSLHRIHIHLTRFDNRDWREIIYFRDYLLKNPWAVEEYIKIKKEGVKKAMGDGAIYREYKRKFIEKIYKLALKQIN